MSKKPAGPVVFDTYRHPDRIESLLSHFDKPSHQNNDIAVVRYRVTIEVVEESHDVLRERLLDLDNQPGHIDKGRAIKAEAKRLGIDMTVPKVTKPE